MRTQSLENLLMLMLATALLFSICGVASVMIFITDENEFFSVFILVTSFLSGMFDLVNIFVNSKLLVLISLLICFSTLAYVSLNGWTLEHRNLVILQLGLLVATIFVSGLALGGMCLRSVVNVDAERMQNQVTRVKNSKGYEDMHGVPAKCSATTLRPEMGMMQDTIESRINGYPKTGSNRIKTSSILCLIGHICVFFGIVSETDIRSLLSSSNKSQVHSCPVITPTVKNNFFKKFRQKLTLAWFNVPDNNEGCYLGDERHTRCLSTTQDTSRSNLKPSKILSKMLDPHNTKDQKNCENDICYDYFKPLIDSVNDREVSPYSDYFTASFIESDASSGYEEISNVILENNSQKIPHTPLIHYNHQSTDGFEETKNICSLSNTKDIQTAVKILERAEIHDCTNVNNVLSESLQHDTFSYEFSPTPTNFQKTHLPSKSVYSINSINSCGKSTQFQPLVHFSLNHQRSVISSFCSFPYGFSTQSSPIKPIKLKTPSRHKFSKSLLNFKKSKHIYDSFSDSQDNKIDLSYLYHLQSKHSISRSIHT